MKLEFSGQIFEKHSNIKFYKNLSSGNRVVACGQTVRMKGIFFFRNFEKAPKKDKVTAFQHHAMTAREKVKAKLHLFLTSLLKRVCGTRRGGRKARIYDPTTTRKAEECY